MLILVCGPSKSGKTTLLSSLRAGSVDILTASDILLSLGRPVHGLTALEILENQQLLLSWFSAKTFGERTILDGHLLIEGVEGMQLVPQSLFSAVPIGGIVFVRPDVSLLATRRRGTDLAATYEQLQIIIEIESLYADHVARNLQVPLISVAPSEIDTFNAAIEALMSGLKVSH